MTQKFVAMSFAAVLLIASAAYFLPGLMGPVDSRAATSAPVTNDPTGLSLPAEELGVESAGSTLASNGRSRIPEAAKGSSPHIQLEASVAAGRVVDFQGLPVQGARVVASARNKWERDTLTDTQGRFELACPVERSMVQLSVPAFEFYAKTWVALGSTDGCTFPSLTVARIDIGDLTLMDGAVIVGRLVDEQGEPVSDAAVLSRPLHYGVKPDDRGDFRVAGLTPGANQLRIYVDRHKDVFQQVVLQAGGVLDVGTIALERSPRFHVSGRVVDQAGVPVPGAMVYSQSDEVIAGVDGGFDFEPCGKHDAWVNASAVGYRESGTLRCDDGAEVEIVVREEGPLCRFLIVDGETGLPLRGASMRVWESAKERTLTLGNGSYRYGVQPGSRPARYETEPIQASSADGRLDANVLLDYDELIVDVDGYLSQPVVPTPEAMNGELQRVEMLRPRSGLITGTVPVGLGVEFPCVVEIHALERLAPHLPMEDVRESGWETPPAYLAGEQHGAELKSWIGKDPVLRVRSRHRIHADEQGRFRFKTNGLMLARAVCFSDDARRQEEGPVAVSDLVCPALDDSLDVGEMLITQLGVIKGHVVLPLPALAARLELALAGRDKRLSAVTGKGAFAFPGLLPGRYRMGASALPDCVPRAPFERIVDVLPGSAEPIVIDPELGEFGELQFTLLLNGAAPSKAYCVRLYRGDQNFLGASDWSPGPAVHMWLPVGAGYRVAVEPDANGLDNSGFELLDRFEVLPGKNVVQLEAESCHLVCAVPAKYFKPEVSGWQVLLWKDRSGKEREPIEAGVHINGSHVASEGVGTIDVEFPCIPVDAQDLRLEIRPWEDEDPKRTRLPFEAELVPGRVVRVELE